MDAADALTTMIKTRRGKVEVSDVKLPTKLVGRVRGKTTHTHTEGGKKGGRREEAGEGGKGIQHIRTHTYTRTRTHTSTYTHKTHERTQARENCISVNL